MFREQNQFQVNGIFLMLLSQPLVLIESFGIFLTTLIMNQQKVKTRVYPSFLGAPAPALPSAPAPAAVV